MRDAFIEVVKASFSAGKDLRKAVSSYLDPKEKMDVVREKAAEVDREESKVDHLESDLTKKIFSMEELRLSHRMHLRQFLVHIAGVSDRAEDAADELELAALKSVV